MVKKSNNDIHEKQQVVNLYKELLKCWNDRNATACTCLFTDDANLVGIDGSHANGNKEIDSHFEEEFKDRHPGAYLSIIREIRFLTSEVALLRAVAGWVPHGKSDIDPGANAIQILVAQNVEGSFRIAVFQNTPAAFHDQPELGEQLTRELRNVLQTMVR